ncbi:hypothetical protein BDR06DRAFT_966976 [Suillus hirtellus]|nr:hypothetical protein BDR06DRAFT_966976 [Suillus hirtellus]
MTTVDQELPQFQLSDHYDSMKDVIQKAQKRLFAMRSKPSNIITLGYKKNFEDGKANSDGITNYFSPAKEHYKQPNFTDREHEIQLLGTCKTPKQLKDVLMLLEKMIWCHGKCYYKLLRDKVCPSEEMVSEKQYIQQDSQVSQKDMLEDTMACGGSQDTKQKLQFADFTCSYSEVSCYAVLVTNAVIPKAFCGCEKNFKIIKGWFVLRIKTMNFTDVSAPDNILYYRVIYDWEMLCQPLIVQFSEKMFRELRSLKQKRSSGNDNLGFHLYSGFQKKLGFSQLSIYVEGQISRITIQGQQYQLIRRSRQHLLFYPMRRLRICI